MATLDWPTTAAFRGARVQMGVDVTDYQFQGFYTGNRTRFSTLADRLTCVVTLPPCLAADAGQREGFLLGLRSAGDYVRLPMMHRRVPVGSMRGSPTVSASAAAGARSLVLAGVTGGGNLALGGSFELDTNADGIANGWTALSSGSFTGLTYGRTTSGGALVHGTYEQAIDVVFTAGGSFVGLERTYQLPDGEGTYTLGLTVRSGGDTQTVRVRVEPRNSGGTIVGSTLTAFSTPFPADGTRLTGQVVMPSTTTQCTVRIEMFSTNTGVNSALRFDGLSLIRGTSGAWPGIGTLAAGDFIGIGGNLIMVGSAGATATDDGLMTVPTAMPLPAALSAGAAVTWNQPTGVWELDTDVLDLVNTPGGVQEGLAIPLRQVVL